MTEVLSAEARSGLMSRIRGKNTKLELTVRRLVWAAGFRYRLHRRDLPGCPDMVFPGLRKVVFIHGCFWHHHAECFAGRIPKSHVDFWTEKLEKNRLRDIKNQACLQEMGWRVLVIWECETKDKELLLLKIKKFLEA